jgi:UDP-N-acetylmuramate--alanine ligase
MFKTIKNIHFVGIGGSGMSGIAEVLINLGYLVSGSDLKGSEVTERLESLGARIGLGHRESNVGEAQVVVTSTAVQSNNPEVRWARKNKIPVIPRIEMLAELARLKYTLAVAGTHGKTTTTSMAAAILQEAGLDPTFIVGGLVKHLGSGAKLGSGEFLVAEADESDGSFLKLSPAVAVITNIDNDHLEYYQTMQRLKDAFIQFANRVPFYGRVIVCADDPGVQSVLPFLTRKVVTYGFKGNHNYRTLDVRTGTSGVQYKLVRNGRGEGEISLNLSGKHNILNSLAACACGLELEVPFEKIARALKSFESVGRRFEKRGEKNGAVWIDDYGHHPTEIRAVISALRERYADREIVVVFQPHRYSRTQILMKDFGHCFAGADRVILLPIYAAGEKPIQGVDSKKLIPAIQRSKVQVEYRNGSGGDLTKYVSPGHVFVTLGAGDIWKLGEKICK